MKNVLFSILMVTGLLFLTSCEHKELCYTHPHTARVRVAFDFQNVPDANPEVMEVFFYNQETNHSFRYQFPKQGGELQLTPGTYSALCFRGETDNVYTANENSYKDFLLTTRATKSLLAYSFGTRAEAPRAKGTEDQEIMIEPDQVYGDAIGIIDIYPVNNEETVVTFFPKDYMTYVDVTILNAKNLQYTQGQSGALSSLSSGVFLTQEQAVNDQIIEPFNVDKKDDTTLYGSLLAWGHCPDARNEHILTIYVILADGSKYSYTWDVTDQMHSAPDQKHIHIVLDGLPIPKPITNGSGFQPDVDGWKSVDIEVGMD